MAILALTQKEMFLLPVKGHHIDFLCDRPLPALHLMYHLVPPAADPHEMERQCVPTVQRTHVLDADIFKRMRNKFMQPRLDLVAVHALHVIVLKLRKIAVHKSVPEFEIGILQPVQPALAPRLLFFRHQHRKFPLDDAELHQIFEIHADFALVEIRLVVNQRERIISKRHRLDDHIIDMALPKLLTK